MDKATINSRIHPGRRKQQLPFDSVPAAVRYYREVTVLLISRTEQHKGIGSFEVCLEDADALYEELQSKGANVEGPPESHPWGPRDFRAVDLEGNRITFARTFE